MVCLSCGSLLAACAPQTEDRTPLTVEQYTGDVSFYPQETGANWAYVPEGSSVEGVGLVKAIEGPTVINNDLWIATRVAGIGTRGAVYRQYREDGVYKLREDASGFRSTYDPPLKEYPAQSELRVGATWSGDSTVTTIFPEAKPEDRRQVFNINYTYTVVDRRNVRLPVGELQVFVINLVGRNFSADGTVANEITQEIWFSPFVGEVRTQEGYFLTRTNVLQAAANARP